MLETSIADMQRLVQQGRAAALAGDTLTARAHFRRATELDPACAEAWVGLSSVAPILDEKRECLRRALALEPGNTDIEAALRYVEQLQAQGMRIAPRRREQPAALPEAPPVPDSPDPAHAAVEYCHNHPDRETGLHCVQCAQPICGKCARMAPVGQLCPKCRRGRRPQQYKVSAGNLAVAGAIGLVASALAGSLAQFMMTRYFGFYLAFFVAPLTAEIIIRITDRLTRAKRGRPMQIVVGGAIVAGMLPFALIDVLPVFELLGEAAAELNITDLFQPNPMMILFIVIGVATAVARLK